MVTGGDYFRVLKRLERGADRAPTPRRVNEWNFPPTLPYTFEACIYLNAVQTAMTTKCV